MYFFHRSIMVNCIIHNVFDFDRGIYVNYQRDNFRFVSEFEILDRRRLNHRG